MKNNQSPWDDPWPNFKWPVAVSHTMAVSADEVWKAISTEGNLEVSHPFCAKNPVHSWGDGGSQDEVHYLNGWIFKRQFLRWWEGVGYDLSISTSTGSTSLVAWRIKADHATQSTLGITIYPYILQKWPAITRYLPYRWYVEPQLEKYLSAVLRGFEWSILNRAPVPRNHFGRHSWFSQASG